MCENGCIYNIEKNVYPNYTVHRESTGLMKNRIDTLNNSLYELIDTCNDDNICGSIDLDINGGGHLYNSHRYLSHQNFTFLIKNNHFTTTSTTNTQTSTTNTQTSTTNTQTSTTNTQTSTIIPKHQQQIPKHQLLIPKHQLLIPKHQQQIPRHQQQIR